MKAVLGHLAYVLESAKELPFLRACSLQVDTGDALYEGEYLFGAVSNTLSVGGILKLDPQAVHLDDGLLELTLVRMPKNPVELGQVRRGPGAPADGAPGGAHLRGGVPLVAGRGVRPRGRPD